MLVMPALIAALAAGSMPSSDGVLLGKWWNSDGSVAVDVARCGSLLCGKVVYAEKRQQEKAHRAGVKEMLGLMVMRNFRAAGPRDWRGTVFVPERNRAFRSTITRVNAEEVRVEGCMLLVLCQHENWRRSRHMGRTAFNGPAHGTSSSGS